MHMISHGGRFFTLFTHVGTKLHTSHTANQHEHTICGNFKNKASENAHVNSENEYLNECGGIPDH